MDELEEAIGKMCGNLKRKGITGDEPKRDPQDGEAAEAHKESASSSFIVKNALTYICLLYTSPEPTRQAEISYAVFCLKKKKKKENILRKA